VKDVGRTYVRAARLRLMIIGVLADMRSAIADQDAFVELAGKALGNDGCRKSSAGNQVIDMFSLSLSSRSIAERGDPLRSGMHSGRAANCFSFEKAICDGEIHPLPGQFP
jgi:hypothetical protein